MKMGTVSENMAESLICQSRDMVKGAVTVMVTRNATLIGRYQHFFRWLGGSMCVQNKVVTAV